MELLGLAFGGIGTLLLIILPIIFGIWLFILVWKKFLGPLTGSATNYLNAAAKAKEREANKGQCE